MKVDDKIDLRPAIQKLATKDLNRLLSADIGELTYDVDLDVFVRHLLRHYTCQLK